ncbi:MAG: hypothetical protein JXR36_03995 [Bacteroidales bacterium]|nr:hypothetical protein [Bacteroidales bacterium]
MFYIIFCLALIFPVWMLFTDLEMPGSVIILVIALMSITFVIIGSYFYLIVALPDRLSRNFDCIRNEIASGEIKSVELFANRVLEFIIKQFNFVFLDIEYAAMGISKNRELFFNDDFPNDMFEDKDFSEYFDKCSETENVTYLGVFKHEDKKVHKYLIPIYFGENYLGFLLAITNKKLSPLFKGILADFENFYVDDQLLHVLNSTKDD